LAEGENVGSPGNIKGGRIRSGIRRTRGTGTSAGLRRPGLDSGSSIGLGPIGLGSDSSAGLGCLGTDTIGVVSLP
jgi:hypothetical protein